MLAKIIIQGSGQELNTDLGSFSQYCKYFITNSKYPWTMEIVSDVIFDVPETSRLESMSSQLTTFSVIVATCKWPSISGMKWLFSLQKTVKHIQELYIYF